MGFREDLFKLSAQVAEWKEHITNEETAKQSLIIPFLQVLGFDVFSPLEVKPEYTADFAKKRNAKVDYAVFKDGFPILFIEAKSVNQNLANHDAQLALYFNSTPAVKFGIITNGIEYKFFTDLNEPNVMDSKPFLTLNITDLSDGDIEALSKFRKEAFEKESLAAFAQEQVYFYNLNNMLEELFKNPSDDFIKLLIKPLKNQVLTSSVVEKFRPIVKKAISTVLLKMVSQGLFPQEPVAAQSETSGTEFSAAKKEVVTSEEELRAFEIVKEMLVRAGRDVSYLDHKDTINYFGIHNRVTTNWVLRLFSESTKKNILTRLPVDKAAELSPGFVVEESPKGLGASRVYIDSIDDLSRLSSLVVECFDSAGK